MRDGRRNFDGGREKAMTKIIEDRERERIEYSLVEVMWH